MEGPDRAEMALVQRQQTRGPMPGGEHHDRGVRSSETEITISGDEPGSLGDVVGPVWFQAVGAGRDLFEE